MTADTKVTADELLERINALGTVTSPGAQAQRRQEIVNELKALDHETKDRERLAKTLSLLVARSRATDARVARLQGASVAPSGPEGSRPALTALNAAKRLQTAVAGRSDISAEEQRLLSQAVDVLWAFSAHEEADT